jgi:hypothetical protein
MLKPILLLAGAAALLSGCANTTTTKFYRDADGALVVESPKNIHAEGVDLQAPNGTHLKIASWDSHVDPSLTTAQGQRESGDVDATASLVNAAVSAAVKAQSPTAAATAATVLK